MKQSEKVELAIYSSDLPEEETTDLDYIPVFQIDNFKTVKERFGISAYESVMNHFEELNDRITQISVQLIKHLNAKVAVVKEFWLKGEIDSDQIFPCGERRHCSAVHHQLKRFDWGGIQADWGNPATDLHSHTDPDFFSRVRWPRRVLRKWRRSKSAWLHFQKDQAKAKKLWGKARGYSENSPFFEGTKKFPDGVDIKFTWDYGLPRDLLTEAQTHQILVESGIEYWDRYP